ncbi:MAG: sulfotransferase domain-containing protein, partial [Methylobacter sp.]
GLPLVSREATSGALYILRNPLDVALSAASHWSVNVDECIKRMGTRDMSLCRTRKGLPAQTRQKLLTWSEHVLSWVDAPGLNCLVMRYEDMLNQPLQTFTQASRFLQLSADAERIEKAIRFSSFIVLSKQEAQKDFKERSSKAERFFRQGTSGAWRDQLTAGQIQKIVADHHVVMRRFGYLDEQGNPL